MKVYQVWHWDPMQSSWGGYDKGKTYAKKSDADADAKHANDEVAADQIRRLGHLVKYT